MSGAVSRTARLQFYPGDFFLDSLPADADRGYFNSPEILACEQASITVTLPKPMTSGAKSDGRYGKQDFVYNAAEDVYRCPAGEKLTYHMTTEQDGGRYL